MTDASLWRPDGDPAADLKEAIKMLGDAEFFPDSDPLGRYVTSHTGDASMWRPGGDPMGDLKAALEMIEEVARTRPRLQVSPLASDSSALVLEPSPDREYRTVLISAKTAERLKAEHPDDAARWGLT